MYAATKARLLTTLLMAFLSCLGLASLASAQPGDRVLRVIGDENYPPYLFLNASGQEEGFLVDVWKLWEKQTGVRVQLKAVKWEEAQKTLLRGDADVIENIFETPGRAPYYDFTKAYADLPVAIYRDVSLSGITSIDALRGFQVGVMEGDACIETLKSKGISSLVYYGNYTRLIQGAAAQDIKVFCLDEYPANFYLYQQGAHRQFVKAFELYRGQFHRAVRKGNLATLQLVEKGMATIPEADIEALRKKWLQTPNDYSHYAKYAVDAALLLLLAAAALTIWICTLRRTVAARTAEIRNAEREVREREQQLRSLEDNLPGGFVYQYEVSPDGARQFNYVSAGVEKLLGVSPAQIMADASLIFRNLDDAYLARYQEAESRSARDLQTFFELLPFTGPAQQRLWLAVSSHPHRSPDGKTIWDGIALDTTARKLTEERLAESEERFRRLFNDSRQAMMLLQEGSFIEANQAALEMLGLTTRDQLIGLRPEQISPEYQSDGKSSSLKASEIIATALRKGSHRFEWEHVRANGEQFIAEVMLTPISFGEQSILHVVWTDISERVRLRKQTKQYETIVQSSEDAIISKSLDGTVSSWNPAAERLFGYTAAEMQGENMDKLLPPQRADEEITILERIARGETIEHFETERVCKNGSLITVSMTISPIRDADGKITGACRIARDISERKRQEAELESYRRDLEKLVEARTSELVQARQIAEAANLAKTSFLTNMSHEIRTPMNSILGFTHLLQQSVSDPKQLDKLRKIEGSSKHLLRLINDILDISKIEADHLQLDNVPFNLGSAIADVHSMFTERLAEKGLHLEESIAPELLHMPLQGDPLRIRQMLANYLGNAIKFTAHGDIRLRISLEAEAQNRVLLRFELEDSGIGISAENQVRLFEPFEQAESSISQRFGGTGLGLSINRRLAQLMDGEVGVRSAPGQGSTFWFTAWLNRGSHEAASRPVVNPDARLRQGARILLVEDNEINQEVARELLQEFGLQVDIANHGGEAVNKVQNQDYDLILMDMQMPVMDGLEATRQIRRLATGSRLPIIAMTANAFVDDRQRCREVGMIDFVAKPVDPAILHATLVRWIPDNPPTIN